MTSRVDLLSPHHPIKGEAINEPLEINKNGVAEIYQNC